MTVLDNTPLAVAGPLLGIAEVDEAEVVAMEPVELAVTVQVYVVVEVGETLMVGVVAPLDQSMLSELELYNCNISAAERARLCMEMSSNFPLKISGLQHVIAPIRRLQK